MTAPRAALLPALALLLAGCGDDVGGTDAGADAGTDGARTDGGFDAGTDAGTDGGGDAGPPLTDLSCLDDIPPFPGPTAPMVAFTARVLEYVTSTAVAGATVRACARSDLDCATPIVTGTTDAGGDVTLMLPTGATGFDGYFEVMSAGHVDAIAIAHPPIVETNDPAEPVIGLVPTPAQLETFATLAGTAPDATRGHVVVNVLDCAGRPAFGAALLTDGSDDTSTRFYFEDGAPSATAPSTDESGVAGFFNLLPGARRVRADDFFGGGTIGSRADVPIRAGWLTGLVLPPSR